jgi:hypothetical protein
LAAVVGGEVETAEVIEGPGRRGTRVGHVGRLD